MIIGFGQRQHDVVMVLKRAVVTKVSGKPHQLHSSHQQRLVTSTSYKKHQCYNNHNNKTNDNIDNNNNKTNDNIDNNNNITSLNATSNLLSILIAVGVVDLC